mgnify:CR=1 FL=1
MTSFIEQLLPATWRGIPFGVSRVRNRLGRRTALHAYPQRDTVWVEDLGRGERRFGFVGFIAGPLAEVQHAAFLLAVEKEGQGTLTHPSLGIFEGKLVNFTDFLSKDALGCYEMEFEFVESTDPQYPDSEADTDADLSLGELNVLNAAGTVFGTALSVIGTAAAILTVAPLIISGWASLPEKLSQDAGAIAASCSGLGDSYGVYSSGSGTAAASDATVASLLTSADTARTDCATACAAAVTAASSGDADTIVSAVEAVPPALRAALADPADQVRVLISVASYASGLEYGTDAFGQAMADTRDAVTALCLRCTLVELARATAAYQPSSYDDALALSERVSGLIQAGAIAAADAGEDAVYIALSQLRAAVVADLEARGASLSHLRTVMFQAPLPAFTLAQRLYQDGTRSDELIRRAAPWHPAFMPTELTVLAS